MSNEKVKGYIKKLFEEMRTETDTIIKNSPNNDTAMNTILDYVSSTVTSKSQGYISSLYSVLSKETLEEPVFKDFENANKFFELKLKEKIYDAYQFDTKNLEAYKKGLSYKEVNAAYVSAAAAVGSGAVGGVLLGALSGMVHIPMVVIIAGALLVGVGGGAVAYKTTVSNNKAAFSGAVSNFLNELEQAMLTWVDSLVEYYNQQVEELKKTL